ncbi:MAG: methyltransferase family protein [Candidatus Kariarchaeaceae archaeon]|jgi:protein-S-isoprenylcysteine O-methyltransferase Ste14
MIRSKDHSIPLTDYGIKSPVHVTFILGLSTLLIMLLWGTIALFRWNTINNEINKCIIIDEDSLIIQLLQYLGLILLIIGIIIASWARNTRGIFAPSWGLNETIPLFRTGPYKYIRHPTYTFQFLVFLGFPIFTLIWPSILSTIGIYGYLKAVIVEEELLKRHFGDEYIDYQKSTSKFFPKIF